MIRNNKKRGKKARINANPRKAKKSQTGSR